MIKGKNEKAETEGELGGDILNLHRAVILKAVADAATDQNYFTERKKKI